MYFFLILTLWDILTIQSYFDCQSLYYIFITFKVIIRLPRSIGVAHVAPVYDASLLAQDPGRTSALQDMSRKVSSDVVYFVVRHGDS